MARTSAARYDPTSASTASRSPETTVEVGPLTAATPSRDGSGVAAIAASTSATGSGTAAIAPRPVRPSPAIARERRATTAAASSSESAPATWAAAISPWEWPITASGRTPAASQSAARDTMTANRAGWTTSTRSRPGAPGRPRSTASSDQSTCGASAFSASSIFAANTVAVSSSPRAMASHWAPWPGKTSTVPAPPAGTARPCTRPGSWPPPARASRPASSSDRSVPVTAARYSKAVRVTASARPRSAGARSCRRDANSLIRAACSLSPAGVRADSGHSAGQGAGSASPPSPSPIAAGSVSGASATRTWALVPPTPKELTPAISRPSGSGHGPDPVRTARPRRSKSMSGFGVRKLRLAGSRRWRTARTVFSRPTRPAAPSRWPTLVFAEPTSNGRSAGRPAPRAAPRPAASTGSPTRVPVPCSSTYCTRPGATSARRAAARITAAWASALGTVSPSVPPSLLTALPSSTACTGSPSATARASGFSTSSTAPSPRA